jgi:hypothetical protein
MMQRLNHSKMKQIQGGDVTVGEGAAFACGVLVAGIASLNIFMVATGLILGPTACGVAIGSLLQ